MGGTAGAKTRCKIGLQHQRGYAGWGALHAPEKRCGKLHLKDWGRWTVGAPQKQRHGGGKQNSGALGRLCGDRGSPSVLTLCPTPTLCQGVRRISPVTRAEEFYYPPWKRLLFQLLVSLPLCLTCLACVFLLMLGCFQLQVTSGPQPWPWP